MGGVGQESWAIGSTTEVKMQYEVASFTLGPPAPSHHNFDNLVH
jgi:hypothetical protein